MYMMKSKITKIHRQSMLTRISHETHMKFTCNISRQIHLKRAYTMYNETHENISCQFHVQIFM